MRAYIIGLEQAYRGAPLEEALAECGIAFERVAGVLVESSFSASAKEVDQSGARVLLRRELTAGEVGCALAHRNACRHLLESDDGIGMIFEDDARLDSARWSSDLLDLIPIDVPTVLSLYSDTGWFVAGDVVARMGEIEIWRSQNVPLNATSYILNRAAAKLLVDEGTPVRYVADWPPHIASKIDFWVTYPWVAPAAADEDSSLAGERAMMGVADASMPIKKFLRHVQAIAHITWFQQRSKYGSYSSYIEHEFRRMFVLAVARHINRTPRGLLRFPWGRRMRVPGSSK